jgi:hypothetical protein
MKKALRFFLPSLFLGGFFLLCAGCPGQGNPPGEKTAGEALESLKQEEIAALRQDILLRHLIDRIAEWFKDHRFYVRIAVFTAACFSALALLFLLFRFLLARRWLKIRKQNVAREFGDINWNPENLARLEAQEDFDNAILYLHRMTILTLLQRKTLSSKNLTNYGILSRIKENTVKSAFKLIAETSEQILFDRCHATPADYTRCKNAFWQCFLEGYKA